LIFFPITRYKKLFRYVPMHKYTAKRTQPLR